MEFPKLTTITNSFPRCHVSYILTIRPTDSNQQPYLRTVFTTPCICLVFCCIVLVCNWTKKFLTWHFLSDLSDPLDSISTLIQPEINQNLPKQYYWLKYIDLIKWYSLKTKNKSCELPPEYRKWWNHNLSILVMTCYFFCSSWYDLSTMSFLLSVSF